MSAEFEGQESVEDNSPETTEQVEDQTPVETGINPVFEPIRQELGLQFEAIHPHLREVEKNFQEHVTKVNGQYAPWKDLAEQGVTPEQVQQSFAMLQRINERPEEIYEALGQFLESNGRLPKTAAEAQQAVEDADETEYDSPEAKRVAELEKQLADFQALVAGQNEQAQEAARAAQQEALNVRAETELNQEIAAFQTAHPGLSQDDWREIQQRHYWYALQGPQHIRSIEDVGKEYFALQERIRSAPRPTDSAPRLPGAGGSVPHGQTKDPSQFTRQESQDALVALLQQGKQQ